jgi:hypothetical protein
MSDKRNPLLHKPTGVYIGRLECGCCVALASDYGDRGTADAVREFILDGLTVSRITWEEYQKVAQEPGFLGCEHQKAKEEAIRAQLSLFGGK